jgi:hypothetical protein
MAEDKKSFIAYTDWGDTFKALPDEKAGQLIKHLFAYVNNENPVSEDVLINAVFANIKQTLKRDLEKYQAIIQRNRDNGSKGGRPRTRSSKPKKPTGITRNPNNPVVTQINPSEPKKPDSDSDSDNGNVIDIEKMKNKIPPPINLVVQYCEERNNGIDANRFYDWYATRGWMVGKDKMKDWQSAIRTWEQKKKDKEKEGIKQPQSLSMP